MRKLRGKTPKNIETFARRERCGRALFSHPRGRARDAFSEPITSVVYASNCVVPFVILQAGPLVRPMADVSCLRCIGTHIPPRDEQEAKPCRNSCEVGQTSRRRRRRRRSVLCERSLALRGQNFGGPSLRRPKRWLDRAVWWTPSKGSGQGGGGAVKK